MRRGLWRTQAGRTVTQPPRRARKGQQVLSPPPTLTPPSRQHTRSKSFPTFNTSLYLAPKTISKMANLMPSAPAGGGGGGGGGADAGSVNCGSASPSVTAARFSSYSPAERYLLSCRPTFGGLASESGLANPSSHNTSFTNSLVDPNLNEPGWDDRITPDPLASDGSGTSDSPDRLSATSRIISHHPDYDGYFANDSTNFPSEEWLEHNEPHQYVLFLVLSGL